MAFFVGRFRNTHSSPIGARFAGVGTDGSIKSEARRDRSRRGCPYWLGWVEMPRAQAETLLATIRRVV